MDTTRILLTEYSSKSVPKKELLDYAGIPLEQLKRILENFIQIKPTWDSNLIELIAGRRVGSIKVGELRIDVQPRMSSRELITLILYAFSEISPNHFRSTIEFEKAGIDEWICSVFADELDKIFQKGLSRLYQKKSERSRVLKGRPNFLASFPFDLSKPSNLVCDHYHITTDNLNNRLIHAILKTASLMDVSNETRKKLLEHRQVWSELSSSLALDQTCFDLAEKNYNRLSQHYSIAHTLGELIWKHFRPYYMFQTGELETGSFIFDMAYLFELFVEKILKEWGKTKNLEIVAQLPDHKALLDGELKLYRKIKPDLIMFQNKKPIAVIDAKYKEYWKEEGFLPFKRVSNEDLYQLFFYTQRLQIKYSLPHPPKAFIFAPLPAVDERNGCYPVSERFRKIIWKSRDGMESCVILVLVPMTEILRDWLMGLNSATCFVDEMMNKYSEGFFI